MIKEKDMAPQEILNRASNVQGLARPAAEAYGERNKDMMQKVPVRSIIKASAITASLMMFTGE